MSPPIQVSSLIRFWQKLHSNAFFKTFGNFWNLSTGDCFDRQGHNSEENKEINKPSHVRKGVFLYCTCLRDVSFTYSSGEVKFQEQEKTTTCVKMGISAILSRF